MSHCVGLIIGGRENYYAEQCKCAGTMFMNAGFSRHWRKLILSNTPAKLIAQKEAILKRLMSGYERSLLLPTRALDEAELSENTLEFNEKFNLRMETRPGTLMLLEKAWDDSKKAAEKNGRC